MHFAKRWSCLVVSALLCILAAPAPRAFAQIPMPGASVNAASFASPQAPNGKLARGGIFTMFGSALSASTQSADFPLPTQLGGAEIEITVGGITRKAILLFVSPGQINAILPSDLPSGAGTLRVNVNGVSSQPAPIEVANHSFGIFTLRSSGTGPGVITDPLDSNRSTAPNTALRAAHPGQAWDLWGTGLTAIETSDAERPPLVDRNNVDVKVLVGDIAAEVVFRGRSPCCAGLDQIRFVIPQGVEGCCVPVQVVVEGVASNPVTMSIAQNSPICTTDLFEGLPDEAFDFMVGDEARTGSITLERERRMSSPTQGTLNEEGRAGFSVSIVREIILDPCPLQGLFPFLSGECTVFRNDGTLIAFDLQGNELRRGQYFTPAAIEGQALTGYQPVIPAEQLQEIGVAQTRLLADGRKEQSGSRTLDAGPALTLQGPTGSHSMVRGPSGGYRATFTNTRFVGNASGVFQAGDYRVTAPGGSGVGSFSVEVPVDEPLEWANIQQAYPEIRRDQPLRLDFSAGGSAYGNALVAGVSATDTGHLTTFLCFLDEARGGFTVPSSLLRTLYRTGEQSSSGHLEIAYGAAEFVSIPGLDLAAVTYTDSIRLPTRYVGEGDSPPVPAVVAKVDPVYPPPARDAGVQGMVRLRVVLNADGTVLGAQPISGDARLMPSAVAAVSQWRFEASVSPFRVAIVEVLYELPDKVTSRVTGD